MAVVSQRMYALHRAVSHTAVQKAIRAGHLDRAIVHSAGKIQINSRIADADWTPNVPKITRKGAKCPLCGRKCT